MQVLLKNIAHHYQDGTGDRVSPLKGLDLELNNGDTVVIYGPSGSGKSTLLFILGCLLRPSEGNVLLDGQSLLQYGEKELAQIRNQKIGFMFQMCYLLPTLTVRENILLPHWIQGGVGKETNQNRETVELLLEQLDLKERADFLPYQLSGGQRRRVALARAMVNDPDIILADEPTAELDEEKKGFVGNWLGQLAKKSKIVVIATHDPQLAAYAGRVYNLRKGKLEEKKTDKKALCG